MQPYKASPTVTLPPIPPEHIHLCSSALKVVLPDEKYLQVLLSCIAQCSSKQGISLPHCSITFLQKGYFSFAKHSSI